MRRPIWGYSVFLHEFDSKIKSNEKNISDAHKNENRLIQMSRDVRKPDFCICENKAADQLCGNRTTDQRLCFRYIDSTISILPKSEILSL